MTKYCWLCYTFPLDPEPELICDRCDQWYCEECSYTFSLHYQHQGCRCYWCADQSRLNALTKIEKRERKLKLIEEVLKGHEFSCY